MDLAPPTEAERKILCDFAEKGGLVVAGPSWGDPPKDDPYAEVPLGKGRVAVYKEDPPNPEAVAKDMLDLLEPEVMGLSVFNVPSAITYASTSDGRVLVQLLNYAGRPIDRVTIRFNGTFKTARFVYAGKRASRTVGSCHGEWPHGTLHTQAGGVGSSAPGMKLRKENFHGRRSRYFFTA